MTCTEEGVAPAVAFLAHDPKGAGGRNVTTHVDK